MVRKFRPSTRSNRVLLLADDDPSYLDATRILLEREGHAVLTATSGEAALKVLARHHVDLLLLDFYMHGMTGEEVVARVREFDAHLQIVLQTGYASEHPPRELLKRLDIQGYHDKADGPDKLLMWVDVGLKAVQAAQQLHRNRVGLQHILDAAPRLHRLQPLAQLLQEIMLQAAAMCDAATREGATGAAPRPGRELHVPDGYLALREDDADLVVQAGTGRYATLAALAELGRPGGPAAAATAAQHKAANAASNDPLMLPDPGLAKVLDSLRPHVDGSATTLPLCVGDQAIGVIHVDQPIRGDQDLELLAVFANQAAVAIRNAQLFEMATIDPLTGVYLRRFAERWAIAEIRKAYRQRTPLTMLMVDMDGLKRINDDAGHLGGDQALASMGQQLRATLRETDLAGRYGGDEFFAILPCTDEHGAARLAQRLLDLLDAASVHYGEHHLPVRGSVGMATLQPSPSEGSGVLPPSFFKDAYQRLVACADAALYEAKRSGKGQLRVAAACAWPLPPAA